MLATVLAGTAVAGALVTAGYQSMAPTGQWYGRTFTGIAPGTKQLALTYDDGPNDPHTFRLLEVLARHDAKATFFLIGRYAKQRPDIVQELVKGGHVEGTSEAVDILFDGSNDWMFSAPRARGVRLHGTGCAYSAAITSGLAQGKSLAPAVGMGKQFITEAIYRELISTRFSPA